MGDWKDTLILEKDEVIIESWQCQHLWLETWVSGSFGFKLGDQVKTELGILVLTNMKIIFLKQEGGFTGKSYHHLFSAPIEMVNSVSLDIKHRKSVAISLTNDDTERFDIPTIKDESSLSPFRELIRKQVSARKEQLGKAQEDSSKKEIIKEKEVIIKIRCKYCGNTYEETLDKCPHCGGHA